MALLLVLVLAYWPGGSGRFSSEPVYPQRITVIDKAHTELHGARLDRWRHARNQAVREWNACGSVQLKVHPGRWWQWHAITLAIGTREVDEHFGVPHEDGWTYGGWTGGYGFSVFDWFGPGTIAHEIGHALGFGHTGRFSVMSDAGHVQDIDCAGLRHYYG